MRLVASCLLAGALLGCNGIFGIDEAALDTGDAAPTAAAGATGTAGAGGGGADASGSGGAGGNGSTADAACSLTATDPCNQCVAQRCCDKLDACLADSSCKQALGAYNTCVGVSFTNDAGGTCDEDFATAGSALNSALGTCAFLNTATSTPAGCSAECHGRPVGGDICTTYCGCMAETCPEKLTEGGGCVTLCGAFSERQLTCRPYHCGLAKNANASQDEAGRRTHCGHAAGEALCP